jgi:dGTPase
LLSKISKGYIINPLYTDKDKERAVRELPRAETPYRSEFRRDYGRLIHSPAFRRLHGKTQLIPGAEGDFFRNRLTHSIEVAQVAKAIALKLNYDLTQKWATDNLTGEPWQIDLDIIEVAGLAHDIGHPPFGHNGEEALDKSMLEYGGFEGNAQTLRILACTEKGGETVACDADGSSEPARVGLNLTYRTLAAILKYDTQIPKVRTKTDKSPIKGYYSSEATLVEKIKQHVLGTNEVDDTVLFKTIECQIMDIADDIAYSTYDVEDAFKAKIVSPLGLVAFVVEHRSDFERSVKKINQRYNWEYSASDAFTLLLDVFDLRKLAGNSGNEGAPTQPWAYAVEWFLRSERIATNGHARKQFTGDLVNAHITSITLDEPNYQFPALTKIKIEPIQQYKITLLKELNLLTVISSHHLRGAEFRGKRVVRKIMKALGDYNENGQNLLPSDALKQFINMDDKSEQMRCICDYLSGMTDRYAIELYERLFGQGVTMYKQS